MKKALIAATLLLAVLIPAAIALTVIGVHVGGQAVLAGMTVTHAPTSAGQVFVLDDAGIGAVLVQSPAGGSGLTGASITGASFDDFIFIEKGSLVGVTGTGTSVLVNTNVGAGVIVLFVSNDGPWPIEVYLNNAPFRTVAPFDTYSGAFF